MGRIRQVHNTFISNSRYPTPSERYPNPHHITVPGGGQGFCMERTPQWSNRCQSQTLRISSSAWHDGTRILVIVEWPGTRPGPFHKCRRLGRTLLVQLSAESRRYEFSTRFWSSLVILGDERWSRLKLVGRSRLKIIPRGI